MKEDFLFKKTPFGGFDRIEVISYIQQLKETQYKYKLMIDEKDGLNRKLSEENAVLTSRVDELEKAAEESQCRLEEVQTELEDIQSKYEEAGKKLAGDTVKMCDELVETASATAKEIVKKAEDEYASTRSIIDGFVKKINENKNLPAKDVKSLMKQLAEEIAHV